MPGCYETWQQIEDEKKSEKAVNKAKLDAVYRERNLCVLLAAKLAEGSEGGKFHAYRAKHEEADTSWENDWRNIVVISGGGKAFAWHIHDSELPHFEFLELWTDYKWDGHTTEEKHQRIIDWE